MEYPESINLCVENNPVNCLDDSCSDGWGWGALFAGTLGLVVANNMFSRAQKAPQYCVVNKENFFTQSEKDFVSQLWRYEKELISCWEKEMWAGLYVLVLMAVKSFNEGWSEFVPGNNDYSPSSAFDNQVGSILRPFCELCQKTLKLNFDSLISAHEWSFIEGKTFTLKYETFSIHYDGEKSSKLN